MDDNAQIKELTGNLEEERQKLCSIIQLFPIAAFVVNNDHKIIHWNKALEKLSGISANEVLGTNQHWRAFYPKERPCLADVLIDKKTEEIPQLYGGKYKKSELIEGAYEVVDFFPALNGGGKWLRFTAMSLFDPSKQNIGAIEMLEDITERKKMEETIHNQQEELQNIFDSVPAWIFYKDKENRFIRVNKVFCEATGMTKEELEGKSLSDIYPKELAEAYWKDDMEVIESGKPKMKIVEQTETKKGRIWVQTDKLPYRDANNNIIGIIGFVVDINDRKKAEEELKAHVEELEALNKAMVGRELKMVELKKELEEAKKQSPQ